MRSSASTPSRSPERPIPLWLLVAGEDHPKACTGRRLIRRRLVLPVSGGRRPRRSPVLLDPHAPEPLSAADRPVALRAGVLAVDCSWNRLADRGGYPTGAEWLRDLPVRRRLPWLVAANPQHYGRLAELNTAEALAGAIAVFGDRTRAASLLDTFPGGAGFLAINGDRLAQYAAAPTAEAVRAAESALFP